MQMKKINRLLLIAIIIFSNNGYSTKKAMIPTEELIRQYVADSDTIFVGKVVGRKIIKDGLKTEQLATYTKIEKGVEVSSGQELRKEIYDVGIWSFEVKKVYRGGIKTGDIQTVCSIIIYPNNSYSPTEMIYTVEGEEYTIFGNKFEKHVFFPAVNDPKQYEKLIFKEIKLNPKIAHHQPQFFKNSWGDNAKIIRDACLEE